MVVWVWIYSNNFHKSKTSKKEKQFLKICYPKMKLDITKYLVLLLCFKWILHVRFFICTSSFVSERFSTETLCKINLHLMTRIIPLSDLYIILWSVGAVENIYTCYLLEHGDLYQCSKGCYICFYKALCNTKLPKLLMHDYIIFCVMIVKWYLKWARRFYSLFRRQK